MGVLIDYRPGRSRKERTLKWESWGGNQVIEAGEGRHWQYARKDVHVENDLTVHCLVPRGVMSLEMGLDTERKPGAEIRGFNRIDFYV